MCALLDLGFSNVLIIFVIVTCFFEKKIYFHKTNLQKNHTYNTKHTIYKRKEIKAKEKSFKLMMCIML